MESSTTDTSNSVTEHPNEDDHGRKGAGPAEERTARALVTLEAVSFLLAATVHAGVVVRGYEHHDAMLAELVIGSVLLVGLASTWVLPRATFLITAAVQTFALLGTLVGVATIVAGFGPRTVPDVAYHASIIVVLLFGIRLTVRARGTER